MTTWADWLLALHRPPRLDDEEVPASLELVPWWRWREHLAWAYGAEVVHVTPPATQEATRFACSDDGPALTDACRYFAAPTDGRASCDGSCVNRRP